MLRILVVACLVGTGAYGAPQRGVQLQGAIGRPISFGGPTAAPGPNYSQQLSFGGPTPTAQSAAAQTQQQRFRIPQNYQQQQPIILQQATPSGAPSHFPAFQSSTPFSLNLQNRSPIVPLRSPVLQTTTQAADDEEYEDEEYEDEPAAPAPRPTQSQFNSPTVRTVPVQRGPPVRIPQQTHQNIFAQPQPQRLIQQQPQPQQIQRRPIQQQQQRLLAPQPTPQQLQSLQPLAPRQPQTRPQGGGGRNRLTTPPPVQTLNRYMRNNDDGSITWGYENEDGTFKEETLGADCVVRGKYGYVDPDGNKREYEYQSGNPCDPNKRGQEEEEDQVLDGPEEQQQPQQPRFNQGSRPLSARRPQQQQQQQQQQPQFQ